MKLPEINELLKDFGSETRQDWEDRIKDGLTPEQLMFDQNLGVSITRERGEHPAYAKFNHKCRIGQTFHYDGNPVVLNKQILASLQNGLEHLIIVVDQHLTSDSANELLDGVISDYIKTTFLLPNTEIQIELNSDWQKQSDTLYIDSTSDHWIALYSDKSPSENIADAVAHIVSSIDQYDTYYMLVSITDQYLAEIATLRAIHHLFNLINEKHGWRKSIQIIATYGDPNHEDLDYQKIGNTARATAAILGGASTILPYGISVVDSEEQRLASNQLHLLRLESYLDQVPDPLRGSHLIESYTDAIAQEAWIKLNEIV